MTASPSQTRAWAWLIMSLSARIILGTTAVAVLWSVVPVAFGWTSVVVVSGSMGPRVRAGDVAIASPIEAAEVRPGQPLLVENPSEPGRLLLHRVIRRNTDGSLVTKGDANSVEDSTPVPPEAVRGLPRLLVRWIGLPVHWYGQREYPKVWITGAVAVLLSMLAAKRLDEDTDENEGAEQTAASVADADTQEIVYDFSDGTLLPRPAAVPAAPQQDPDTVSARHTHGPPRGGRHTVAGSHRANRSRGRHRRRHRLTR